MVPKPIKQSLKYNTLLLPKEHRLATQNLNFELWNDLGIINRNFPNVQINVDHIIKDFGNYYGIDLKLTCMNKDVQKMLDMTYERNMQMPRFEKHEHFDAMISIS
ncbi:hypothetical protein [Pedobacter miscanthi]|uniref:hypothetical protein n=1 Tax=Pedobacter miscanthi TaxID=2259170 RepID=UPI00292E55EA|nr:hypothetical protein [Pedobacter miscanthi]